MENQIPNPYKGKAIAESKSAKTCFPFYRGSFFATVF